MSTSQDSASRSLTVAARLVRHEFLQELERFLLLLASGLLDDHRQLAVLRLNLGHWQELGARRQDRGLDDGVLGAVEAEELAQGAVIDDLDIDLDAILAVVDAANAELIRPASVAQHP